jgi:hypothetical protein
MPEPRSGERGAEGFGIGHDGVASKVQRLTGALRRVGMTGAAGILDHHRNDSEIGGVARGRLDADFPRNAPGMTPQIYFHLSVELRSPLPRPTRGFAGIHTTSYP